ncbi:hypothetical protein F2P47_14400 [Parvibaculum sedimenti]|uniref:Glycosyltransferase RgtA/B/C/D-like domain-containing protein n=1 Tax=Parvibaculum sedimenti TaxID=2608632 RepID=A0A6N6VFH5_9HYPH|nr:hypothetical protein [Parvibaculum sedimenti]KAB7738986.1 hypothetical protein F2P47_14400 [Parvibaculum sedimenti]
MPEAGNQSGAARPDIRTFGVSWPLLIALGTLFGALGSSRFNAVLADPDTYWHLATGRWIIEHKALPLSDPFSHSMPGASWMTHEWLSELALTGVYQAAGWTGLVVLVVLLFAGTLAYLMRFLLARMEPADALLFTGFAGSMLMSHLLVRPHVLVWPLLAMWVGALVNAVEERRYPPWWLVPLMALWANMHGSFTLGLALGAALALDAVLASSREQRRAAAMRWGSFVGLSVVASMVTPLGWHGLWFSVEFMRMPVLLDSIIEWRSPDFHKPQIFELWLLLILVLGCTGRLRLPWLRLLMLLALVHLALKHQRHVEILGLVSPFLIASSIASRKPVEEGARQNAATLDRLFHALAAPARPGALAVAILSGALWIGAVLKAGGYAPAAEITPEAAMRAAAQAGAAGPVFNSFEFGGYLIFRGVPVFIDGRADMYGDAFLKRYLDALNLTDPENLPKILADYHVGWTLLHKGTPAVAVLDRMPGWRRVYSDELAVVHVREDGGVTRAGAASGASN